MLSRLDRRRDLLYFGGINLNTLFGTAIVNDVHKLHDVFMELKSRNSDIFGSIQKIQGSNCKKKSAYLGC